MVYIKCILSVLPPIRVRVQHGASHKNDESRHAPEASMVSLSSLLPVDAARFRPSGIEFMLLVGSVAVLLGCFLAAPATSSPVLPFYFLHEGPGCRVEKRRTQCESA